MQGAIESSKPQPSRLMRATLVLLAVAVLCPASTSAQFHRMMFGPPPVPVPQPMRPPPCRCVPASRCPAPLAAASAAFCSAGLVCCPSATSAAVISTGGGARTCGRPGRPDSGPVWTVAVTRRDPDGLLYRCAGALLSSMHVITSAHSVAQLPADELVVVANMEDLLEDLDQEIFRRVSAVLVHPRYYPGDQQHNLAILRLDTPLETPTAAPAATPVCLSVPPAPTVDPSGNCWASGWGRDIASHDSATAPLVDVRISFASSSECLDSLADHGQTIALASDLCVRPRSAGDSLCQLDAGSPVVCQAADGAAALVGVVSWARRCAGRRKAPMVVAAAIAPHLDWIVAVLEA